MHKIKNRIAQLFLVFSVLILFVSCDSKHEHHERVILVSSVPLEVMTKDLLNGIQGWHIHRISEDSHGCDHNHSLSVSDIRSICNAKIALYSGESYIREAGAACPKTLFVNVTQGYDYLRPMADGNPDPHLWFSPRALEFELQMLTIALKPFMVQDSVALIRNRETLSKSIEIIQDSLVSLAKVVQGKKAAMFHEAFGYLLRDLNMIVAVSWGHHEGAAPSAQDLAQWIQVIKNDSVSVILASPEDQHGPAQLVATETKVPIITLDVLNHGWATEDSVSMQNWSNRYQSNLFKLKTALVKE